MTMAARENRALEMLHDLETPRKELSKWELGFLESLSEHLTHPVHGQAVPTLSDDQFDKLAEIWEDKAR